MTNDHMNILVFNCGSSSLKYRLIAMPGEKELAAGEAQRIGPPTAEPSRIVHHIHGQQRVHVVPMSDHATAFDMVMCILASQPELMPQAIGHRLAHGGPHFTRHVIVDDGVLDGLLAVRDLAPLHNPPAVALIQACRQKYPDLPQTVVFDTVFHATIPPCASTYALPAELRGQLGLRKYGFHGTSHEYVAQEAAKFLGLPMSRLNAVSCHLGSGGASLCAIVNGRSVDNTMGYSTLQGLVMSTRCGDVDPAVVLGLLARRQGRADQVEALLARRSGVLGLSGMTADVRDVLAKNENPASGSERLNDTWRVYLWRIHKYLGAYLAVVGAADTVIFTDTIGELVPQVRGAVCAGLESFGLVLDPRKNGATTKLPVDVAADHSAVRVLVIATNEELAIARYSYALLGRFDADDSLGGRKIMNVLVLDPRQRSLRYGLFGPKASRPLKAGTLNDYRGTAPDSESAGAALKRIKSAIMRPANPGRIDLLAIRVPFGGEIFRTPAVYDAAIRHEMERLIPQAPLHLSGVLVLAGAAEAEFAGTPIVMVFETAFFVDLPQGERLYGLDPDLTKGLHLRRYGYHGIYHQAAWACAVEQLARAGRQGPSRILSVCLEPCPEIAAILGAGPVMVTSGATPLEGLPGERTCGELDPGIVLTLASNKGWGPEQINNVLTTQSGLRGLAGNGVTLADLFRENPIESPALRLARDVMQYRMLLACGAGIAALGGLDGLVFSGRYAGLGQCLGPYLTAKLAPRRTGDCPPIAWHCFPASLGRLIADQAAATFAAGQLAISAERSVRARQPVP